MTSDDLFDWKPPPPSDVKGMIRTPDYVTSIESAHVVNSFRTKLQAEIYDVLVRLGPMTDLQLESLPQFSHYGPSTVRKRRSELLQAGRVRATGAKIGRLLVWEAVNIPGRSA